MTPVAHALVDRLHDGLAVLIEKLLHASCVLDRLSVEDNVARLSSGLLDAERALDLTSDAEDTALLAISACRCNTLDEVRMQVGYLMNDPRVADYVDHIPESITALLHTLRGVGAYVPPTWALVPT
jgi:hypothetical protein